MSSSYFDRPPEAGYEGPELADNTTPFEAYLHSLQRFGIRPGHERIRALLHAAGDPQNAYPVVLIGGTNGKGSTCEYLARGLAAEGRRVGLYTSPHLYRWNERIRVLPPTLSARDAAAVAFTGAISDKDLDELFADSMPLIKAVAREGGRPTEFETLTFMGLWHFARQRVDVAVVEVGLGGLWDATNVCEPLVSVVTHVALDHCDRLGNTVEEIARDKVAIARTGRVLITADSNASVLQVMKEHCDGVGALLWPLAAAGDALPAELAPLQACLLQSEGAAPAAETLALEGGLNLGAEASAVPAFQLVNRRTAAAARCALGAALSWSAPATLSDSYGPLVVPGRAEVARRQPLVVLDGANNPDGAAHLAAHLRTCYPDHKFAFVVGISADKHLEAMLECWAPLACRLLASEADHPRAAAAEVVAAAARTLMTDVAVVKPVRRAIEQAITLASSNVDCNAVCICGSFFLLASADRQFISDFQPPVTI